MQVAKKKVVSSKAKKAIRTTPASKKIKSVAKKVSGLKEHKNAAKACRHFLRQVTTFNGLVIKLTKAKLGDKRYIINVQRAFEKMQKLWAQYGKVSHSLNEAEKHLHAKPKAAKVVKKAKKVTKKVKMTSKAKKTVKSKKVTSAKKTTSAKNAQS
jgi:hypothetical protein